MLDLWKHGKTLLQCCSQVHDFYFYLLTQKAAEVDQLDARHFACWQDCPLDAFPPSSVGTDEWKQQVSMLGRLNRVEVLTPTVRVVAESLLRQCRPHSFGFNFIHRSFKPSTGFMALFIALGMCEYQGTRSSRYCHYEDTKPTKCSRASHDLHHEWSLVRQSVPLCVEYLLTLNKLC